MKRLLAVVLSALIFTASGQWSNTTNIFKDSLHMPVAVITGEQKNPIVINSYPDGGYFVVWEDERNAATLSTDIYAQKYDAAGNRLWAVNGVPVANAANREHFTFSSNQDYRNRSYAATDSSGGFYIAYANDSISTYDWERVMVQHVRSNGTNVFPGGYILVRSSAPNLSTSPQLIADGNKGFFIAYRNSQGNDYVYLYCYKDENGSLKYYGGGRANENAIQTSAIAPCGIKTSVEYPGTSVSDFNIWSDRNGGCNVVISMSGNTGLQGNMLAYNRLWRAKKNAVVQTYFRNSTGTACPRITEYQKDDVYLLYVLHTDFQSVFCGGGEGPAYAYTNFRLLSNGYQVIDNSGYDYYYAKGVTLITDGNINADLIAVTRRTYANNTVSPFTVQGYLYEVEKFDSVPYQRSSYTNPDFGYNTTSYKNLDKLNFFRDTILASSSYYADFSLAGNSSHIYAAGLMDPYGVGTVRLQHLQLTRQSSDSFALNYSTAAAGKPEKRGVAIGSEISTGFSGSNISYDHPLVAINKSGNAMFYIREYYRGARVSPIDDTRLRWGAMGRPISNGVYNNSYYNLEQPVATLDTAGKTAVIAWRDDKYNGVATSDNIFMRHIDKLDDIIYTPPLSKILPLYNYSGDFVANPAVLLGSSKAFTPIEVYNPQTTFTTPVAAIWDNNYLGRIIAEVYQQTGDMRVYNGQPYLGRNYNFKSDSLPPNAGIDIKLYFTTAEFNALKGADASIVDPSYLSVIHQPNTTSPTPTVYTPIAGEEVLTPTDVDSVDGGYYVWITTSSLGNFFIQKLAPTSLCAGGSASLVSNITGSNYQWQVKAAGTRGYTSLSNGVNYSGANTATLKLNNVPASFNGYHYRCVVDASKLSNAFFLEVANTWTGTINNTWENAGNWSCGKVPDATTDVIIKSGIVTVNSNAVCHSLSVSAGVNFTVAPGYNLIVTH